MKVVGNWGEWLGYQKVESTMEGRGMKGFTRKTNKPTCEA